MWSSIYRSKEHCCANIVTRMHMLELRWEDMFWSEEPAVKKMLWLVGGWELKFRLDLESNQEDSR